MMNSNPNLRRRATLVLRQILGMLDDQLVGHLIDEPIDRALRTFQFKWKGPFAPRDFHRVLGRFLAEVHGDGSAGGRLATFRTDEAVALLSRTYQGTYEHGYAGAILDVAHLGSFGIGGIDAVLVNFAGILKSVRRQQYAEWVFARSIDPFDKPLRRELAGCILEYFDGEKPDDVEDLTEMAEDIPHLFEAMRGNRGIIAALQSDRFASFE